MPSSDDVRAKIREAVEAARGLQPPAVEGDVLIVGSGPAAAAAKIFHVAALAAGIKAAYATPVEASVLVMPYRDFDSVVVYLSDPKDPRALRTVEESLLLGYRTSLVAPELPGDLVARLSQRPGLTIITVGKAPVTTMAAAATVWGQRLLGSSPRGSRLRTEVDDLLGAADWVSQTYAAALAEMSSRRSFSIYFTPATEPGAIYLCHADSRCSGMRPLEDLRKGSAAETDVVELATTSEIHDYKDVELAVSMRGLKPIRVLLNTDPVSAGLYSVMFSALAAGVVL